MYGETPPGSDRGLVYRETLPGSDRAKVVLEDQDSDKLYHAKEGRIELEFFLNRNKAVKFWNTKVKKPEWSRTECGKYWPGMSGFPCAVKVQYTNDRKEGLF